MVARRTPECLLFASGTVRHDSTGPGAFAAGSPMPVPLSFRGEGRASQVPGKPLYGHALLFDPGGPSLPSHTAGSCCLPAFENCRRLPLPQFRGSITRPIHSLCTLRSGGYPTPRNTRCRLVASLGRVGLSPTGFHDILSTFSVSRMSRLCLAHSKQCKHIFTPQPQTRNSSASDSLVRKELAPVVLHLNT